MGVDSAGAVRDDRGGRFHGDGARAIGGVLPCPLAAAAGHRAIADRRYAPGATARLATGPHTLHTTAPEPDLRLLWGRANRIPAVEPSEMPIYTGL